LFPFGINLDADHVAATCAAMLAMVLRTTVKQLAVLGALPSVIRPLSCPLLEAGVGRR
jgi:hypothetical protein